MGNASTITSGEIQVMSAGTGIQHSEFNTGKETLNLLQIWVFPNKRNVTPRYDQQLLDQAAMENAFAQVLSPNPDDTGVWIHQDAWFHMGKFSLTKNETYHIHKKGNGAYIFVIEGSIRIGEQLLNKRDALGVWDTELIDLHIEANSHVLIMEIPMDLVQN
jgi:redox-sensitive bicupin YhaK (pirin superfamily)